MRQVGPGPTIGRKRRRPTWRAWRLGSGGGRDAGTGERWARRIKLATEERFQVLNLDQPDFELAALKVGVLKFFVREGISLGANFGELLVQAPGLGKQIAATALDGREQHGYLGGSVGHERTELFA